MENMKKTFNKNSCINLIAAMVVILLAGSCGKDFLNREPLSQLSPSSSFNSQTQLALYANSFYNDVLPGAAELYMENAGVDDIITSEMQPEVTGNRTIPVSGGGWDWTALRNINFFLQNYRRGNLPEDITAPYVGVAKFFRAYFYFEKIKRFGDVPWYSGAIEANDSVMLSKARDSRMLVVDSVMTDLDDAIAHLPEDKAIDQVTKWTALALKSRIGLYEGTWRKYHANDEFGKDMNGKPLTAWQELLQQSVAASEMLMESGKYAIYKSMPDKAYGELFSSSAPLSEEIILARTFSSDLGLRHSLNFYTVSTSNWKPGLEKRLVNSYLMKDGSRFTDQAGYMTRQFSRETQNRDPRLSQTIRTPGYSRIGNTALAAPNLGASVTGYQLIKFVSDPSQDGYNQSVTPLPVFRYAEVLLNYAEAKAELGTLQQDDLDKSIRLLRDRVGMPDLDVAAANAHPDPYLAAQYLQVQGKDQGVILEIRRERRIELVMENFRWDDLMRWKEGHLLTNQFYGEYFPGAGSFDLDGNGNTDFVIYTGDKPATQQGVTYMKLGSDIALENGPGGGRVVVNGGIVKNFQENRDYLFPIPIQERLLNPHLSQNPNWDK